MLLKPPEVELGVPNPEPNEEDDPNSEVSIVGVSGVVGVVGVNVGP